MDKWCLIDSTWGAGFIMSGAFYKYNTEYYLCTPAGQFVRTHMPIENNKDLQFLKEPIDLITFQKLVKTNAFFFDYGFLGVAYDEHLQNICGRGRIVLKFDENKSPTITFNLKKGTERKDDYITSRKIKNSYYYIEFFIDEEGEYDLTFFGSFSFLSFLIKCDSPPNEKQTFPYFSTEYKDNMELISPITSNLESGKKYNFKILDPEHNQLYLNMLTSMDTIHSDYVKIPMDKNGAYFIKNDVVIFKEVVHIGYKDSTDNFHIIVGYSIIE